MSVAQIERLESFNVSVDDSESSLKEECCSICLDAFTVDSKVRRMEGCGHVFH